MKNTKYCLFASLVLYAGSASAAEEAPRPGTDRDRPSFVIILADDLGHGDVSCYGGWIRTRHLDRLAKEGMRFTDFHSSGAVCSPTRAGLVTGRYQQRAGIPGVINADPDMEVHGYGLSTSEITLAECLREAGYATAITGKWHLGYDRRYNPVHHGFDLFRGYVSGNIDYISHRDRMGTPDWWHDLEQVDEEGYSTHLITKHAVRFIEKNRSRPFLLYIAHEAVHSPYQGPGDPPQRGPDRKPKSKLAPVKTAYRQMMEAMDEGVGEVVATLRRLGIEKRTLVWFLSDNGANRRGSNAPLRGFKGSLWEGGHRVPSIAWWPGRIREGVVNDSLAISLDVMPTLLSLAGTTLPTDHTLDGADLSGVLLEGSTLRDRRLFWQHGPQQAMRDGPWKLVRTAPRVAPQLFHLGRDLGEERDLSPGESERVGEMMRALEAWEMEVTQGATNQPAK